MTRETHTRDLVQTGGGESGAGCSARVGSIHPMTARGVRVRKGVFVCACVCGQDMGCILTVSSSSPLMIPGGRQTPAQKEGTEEGWNRIVADVADAHVRLQREEGGMKLKGLNYSVLTKLQPPLGFCFLSRRHRGSRRRAARIEFGAGGGAEPRPVVRRLQHVRLSHAD